MILTKQFKFYKMILTKQFKFYKNFDSRQMKSKSNPPTIQSQSISVVVKHGKPSQRSECVLLARQETFHEQWVPNKNANQSNDGTV